MTAVHARLVHALSAIPVEEWNSHAHISARITQTVLTLFPSPESLGEFHIRAALGTPMEAAASRGQAEVLRALLASPGWREDGISKAAALASELARVELENLEAADLVRLDEVESVRRRREVVRILEAEIQPDFDVRIAALEKIATRNSEEPKTDRDSEWVNTSVDLSVLTKEKPSGWTEGCEMTAEMSLRIFLKHFRNDNQLL
jgi:hypothetical protein